MATGCDHPSSLGRVSAWNCERSAVSFVLKCCPISTTFRNPAFTRVNLLWYLLNSFSILFQQKILIRWVITIQRNFCLDHTEHNWLSHHLIRSPWSFVKGFIFFTHFRDCSVKTGRPKIECCLHSETKFLSGLHVTMQATGRDYQHGSNSCVSLDPSSRLWWSIFSWEECIHDKPLHKIVSSALNHEILSKFNNT